MPVATLVRSMSRTFRENIQRKERADVLCFDRAIKSEGVCDEGFDSCDGALQVDQRGDDGVAAVLLTRVWKRRGHSALW